MNALLTLLIFAAGCVAGWQWQKQQQRTERTIVNAIENLNAAVAALQKSVDAAVTDITTPHPTEAAVQAAADAVNAQAARLDTAVGTPAAP